MGSSSNTALETPPHIHSQKSFQMDAMLKPKKQIFKTFGDGYTIQ